MRAPCISLKNGFRLFAVLITFLFSSMAFSSNAQHRQMHMHEAATSRNIAHIQTRMMNERLKLVASQKTKVSVINERYAGKLSQLLSSTQLSKEQKLVELQKLHADKKADLQTILSDSQYKEYLKLQQDLKDERARRMSTETQADPDNQ